ncbi:non-hydrolyzing UDP-N-acetylglucosamine 2-epimerase [Massilia sp. LXY-6]|uniref:non-hydrolyzing UDP-N-acetylglucosamine 2-epimerase n=1 Tax=Massilia sp. LXY-6 TaxID=3379823 RepID=UPI003EDEF681
MTSRKILTIIGARPQFIKASAVSAAIAACPQLTEIVVHTGQHFDANMSDVFFPELGMDKPAYHLAIHGCGHGEMTGRMLIDIEKVMLTEKPDAVLVYGDTNSTLAGALAAAKLHIPVAHVEAGLRSFNMVMPEEINRILTDRVAEWLFTPTSAADQHLLREGVAENRIHQVGDVMFDVALRHGARASAQSDQVRKLDPALQSQAYCLITIHRAENTDNPARMGVIVDALAAFAEQTPVIWPLHPRTRAVFAKQGTLEALARSVTLLNPLGYLDMVYLEKQASLIATDSGGVQKEAFFYRVPCVTLRDETEWTELVEGGWNRVAPPTGAATVLAALRASLGTCGDDIMPYGRGDAAERIVQQLVTDLD